jgi:tetratricopeptide (TPR) repeat protein
LAALVEANFYFDRGKYDAARGRFSEYEKDAQEAFPQLAQMSAIEHEYWSGLLEWKQGRLDAARKKLEQVRLLLAEVPEGKSDLAVQLEKNSQILQAEIWLSEGRAPEAISVLEKEFRLQIPIIFPAYALVYTLYNFPLDQDVLARSYQKMGNLDKAIEEYKKLLNPASQDRRLHYPVYHYRLAKLYEEKGLKAEAKKEYARFLEFWKDADPGIREFADAKKRLARL